MTKKVQVKEEDQVVEVFDVKKPVALPEIGLLLIAAMSKRPEAMYPYARCTMLIS